MRSPFSLLCREGIWYVRLWDFQEARYLTARTTSTRNKKEAEKIAASRARELKEKNGDKTRKLIDFAHTFWAWGKSSYIRKKLLYAPNSITKAYADYNLAYIETFASKYFRNRTLQEIKPIDLENYTIYLREHLKSHKNATINKIVAAITKPLAEAYRLGIIDANPVRGSYRLPTEPFTKGIFSQEEIARIAEVDWDDERALNAFRLAATGGLRLGEIRALRVEDLGGDFINVCHSFSKTAGLKCPKNRKTRSIPIPTLLADELRRLAKNDPNKSGWIFWGADPAKPVSDKVITCEFYRALEVIGITDDQRRQRHLSFHSLRHFTNASLRGSVSDDKLRLIIGHSSIQMTDRYDHPTAEKFADIRRAQEIMILPYIQRGA